MTNRNNPFYNSILVKESLIHGKGIFASSFIPKDSVIMKIEGEIISGDECERREEEEDNVYIFWNGDDCYIDTAQTEKIKYINHDCNYNCDVEEGPDKSIILIAVKEINPGDELTIDYGYEEIYEDCSCNSCLSSPVKKAV